MTDDVAAGLPDPPQQPAPSAAADLPAPPADTGSDGAGTDAFWGTDEERPGGFGKWELAAGAVLLVVAILVILNLTGGGDEDDDATNLDSDVTQPASGNTPGGTTPGSAPPAPTSTLLPNHTPREVKFSVPAIVDDFDGPNADSLGETNGDQPWTSVAGVWGTRDEAARVLEPNEIGARNFAIVEGVLINQGTITAEMVDVADGAGVVFKYRNSTNFFAVTANAAAGKWEVGVIEAGVREIVGTSLPAPVTGNVTITVQLRGFWIDIYADGVPVLSVRDERFPLAGEAGIYVARAAAETTSFNGFIAGQFEGEASDPADPADGTAPPADG